MTSALKKSSQRLSWPERAERRRQMAMEVQEGASLATVAQRYEVTLPTVRNACLEHSVRWAVDSRRTRVKPGVRP